MKKVLRLGAVFILALFISISHLAPVYAAADPYSEAYFAGDFITQLMLLVNDKYVGGDVSMEELADGAIRGLMNTLDPYSEYMNAKEYSNFLDLLSGSYIGVGINLAKGYDGNLYVESVYDGSSAAKAGIKPGDLLYKVNGAFVTGWNFTKMQNLMGTLGETPFKLTVVRDLKAVEFTVKQESADYKTIYADVFDKVYKTERKTDPVGYVYMASVGSTTGDELREAVKKFKTLGVNTLILDMRGNPGGYVDAAIDICNQIVPKGPIMYVQEKNAARVEILSKLEKPPFDKIYVLVDGYTASAAEIIGSALQDSGIAVVVGERSHGKGVMQSVYELGDGSCIKLTTGEYFRRNGGKFNGLGITPDIYVSGAATGGGDPCLEAVISEMLER